MLNSINSIEFMVYGDYALFAEPLTKIGGEKLTMQAPTYEALKGITESIYWKPSIIWIIDSVRIMNPIQTESKSILIPESKSKPYSKDLSIYTYLRKPKYHVRAHFEFNMHRPFLACDHDERKHIAIAKRMVDKGGRRDIFLGTRECQGYVEPCGFFDGEGFYDNYGQIDLGWQVHGFNYPGETSNNELSVRLWNVAINNGIINFPRPDVFSKESSSYPIRVLRNRVAARKFVPGINFANISDDAELSIIAKEG